MSSKFKTPLFTRWLESKVAAVTFLSLFLTSVQAFSALQCSEVFNPHLSEIYSLTEKIKERYIVSMKGTELIEFGSGQQSVLESKRLIRTPEVDPKDPWVAIDDFKVIEVYSVTQAKKLQGQASPSRLEKFNQEINEAIEFVLSSYEKRRKWGAEFRQHLHEQASKYQSQTTLIKFYSERILKATLKIVTALENRNEKLPIEENLKIILPYNAGVKFELGNFAIERSHNKEAFIDLLLNLMIHASEVKKRPGYIKNQPIYFTYADEFSRKMYQGLGFKPVPGFKEPIVADGVSWVVMGLSAEGVLAIPHFMQTTRSFWQPDFLDFVSKYFKNLKTFDDQQLDQAVWSVGNINVHLYRPAAIQTPELNRYYKYRRLLITDPGNWHMFVNLPLNIIPLQEGLKLSLQKNHVLITYQSGQLKIVKRDGAKKRTVKLKVDPDFHLVSDVQLEN